VRAAFGAWLVAAGVPVGRAGGVAKRPGRPSQER